MPESTIDFKRYYEKASALLQEYQMGIVPKLEAKVAELQEERDAMLSDLRKLASCEMCKHGKRCQWPQDYHKCKMLKSRYWEWRGVQKEGE